MRPGAGYLPTLALGRPRGPATGVAHMTLLRRRPRELYRVYGEDEFLTIDDWLDEAEDSELNFDLGSPDLGDPDAVVKSLPIDRERAVRGPARRPRPDRRSRRGLRRLAGVAVPAAVAMIVSAVLAHDLRSGATSNGRSGLGLRSSRAAADSAPPNSTPVSQPESRHQDRRAVRLVSRARRASRAPHLSRASRDTAERRRTAVPGGRIAVSTPSPPPSSPPVTDAGRKGGWGLIPTASASASTRPAVATAAATPRRTGPEFGFERR
jgi:hypothetical protein